MNAQRVVCVVFALILTSCSRPPPAPPPPLQATDGAGANSAQLSATLAATLRAVGDGQVRGTIVLAQDAQSLVLGAALDGLPMGDYRLLTARDDNCAIPSSTASSARVEFSAFSADVHKQAKFSQRVVIDRPLTSFVGHTVRIYSGVLAATETPDTSQRPVACGVLEPIAR